MTSPNSRNAINQPEETKKPRDFVREFVTPFMEAKLSANNGGGFYSHIKASRGDIGPDFITYWKSKNEWNNLSVEEKKTLEGMEKALFLKEAVRIGAGMESKRDTLEKVLDREYNLTDNQKNILISEIKLFPLADLTKHLNFHTTRKEFMERTFPKKETQPQELDYLGQFEAVFGKENIILNEDQKEGVARLLQSPHVSERDVEAILPLFTTPDEKQLLVKYFLPTITLAELEEMGIIDKHQVRLYIQKYVQSQIIGNDFSIEDDLIDSVDPSDIILPTYLLPESSVDRLLAGKGRAAIAKQIEMNNQETIKDFENNNILGLSFDEDGKILPAFQTKIASELKVPNANNFNEGSYIRVRIKQPDGTFELCHYAIASIDDDPTKNRANGGNGRQITIKNILTADGSVDKNWDKKPGIQCSYGDIYAQFEKAIKSKGGFPEITTQQELNVQVEKGEMKEKILREDIDSLGVLNNALDILDKDGKKYPLQKGSSIQVGEPGKKDFWVFQVKSINETDKTIALSDGGSQEILNFQEFFDNFESREGARLPKIEGPEDFLNAIQAHSPKSKEFDKIVYNKDRGIFVPEDRKDDKNFPGIIQFGGEKQTITLHSIDSSGLATWTLGEWDSKEKKYKGGSEGYKAGWNALYAQFLSLGATPAIPDVPLTAPDQKHAEMHEKHGYLKHYMGNPSLHDMFAGAKGLIDFVKHKFEHGAKGHSAKFQLALGRKLGFNDEMMRELRNKVHGKTKELMEEMIKDLSGLPSGERQTEVKHILENHGSHDYEIQAAIIAMLKKHGNLYVGSPLKGLEGSFIFFERLSGTKYSKDNIHVQRALKACKEKGILFREEFLIENYLQFIGGKNGGYQVDWNLWLDVKRGWADGMKGEAESGEANAGTFGTLDGRLNWVYEKFEGGEYSNGIGAMKKVWSKGGAPHKMHEPAIYLALSNITTRLHGSQLDALKNEFYGGGHPYPALTALATPEKLAIFQKTVKILCEGNPDMKKSYQAIEDARSKNVGDSMGAIRKFWSIYGSELHKKLLISQDPEILYKAEFETNHETRDILKTYVKNYKGDTGAMGEFNKDELEEGTYGYDHSGFSWSADAYLKRVKIDRGPGTMGDDKGSTTVWNGYINSLKDIKTQSLPGTTEENQIFRYKRYKEYHKAFYLNVLERMGADWADEDKSGKTKMEKQNYMRDLQKLGFSRPPWKDKDKLETPEYDRIVQRDFNDYMSGGIRTIGDEKDIVVTNINKIL